MAFSCFVQNEWQMKASFWSSASEITVPKKDLRGHANSGNILVQIQKLLSRLQVVKNLCQLSGQTATIVLPQGIKIGTVLSKGVAFPCTERT